MPSFLKDFPMILFHAVSSLFTLDAGTAVIPADVWVQNHNILDTNNIWRVPAHLFILLFLLHLRQTHCFIPFCKKKKVCFHGAIESVLEFHQSEPLVDCESSLILTTEAHAFTGCTFTCPVVLSPSLYWPYDEHPLSIPFLPLVSSSPQIRSGVTQEKSGEKRGRGWWWLAGSVL